ncbi:MAG: DUF5305 domain-containing protein [Tissierellaceae bacterium]|nr:DUF5305 domain-containing protein [Tissierellaceae bacterium]
MKVNMEKHIRISITLIVLAILVTALALLYQIIKNPKFEDQLEEIYSYNNQANIDYEVIVKPNLLVENPYKNGSQIYISELVSGIKLFFSHQFTGENKADLYGNYVIRAELLGSIYRGQEEGSAVIWSKEYPLKARKMRISEKQYQLDETLSLDLTGYREFLLEVAELTKINFDTSLVISMDVDLKGSTDKGGFEEHLTPNIIIPLNTAMFEIGGTPTVERPGTIERTIEVQLPVDKEKLIFFGILLAISALGLIFLMFFTETAPKKDQLEKELNRIFKKHGDRLVTLESQMDISNSILVKSMEDLVRFADEVNRPILYIYKENYNEINKFFVDNSGEVYVFNLENLISKEEVTGVQETTSGEES